MLHSNFTSIILPCLVLSVSLTSAFVIQHSADGTLVLILVLKCGWIITVELKPFLRWDLLRVRGISMMLVFIPLHGTDINVPIRRTAHLTLSSPPQVISMRKNGELKERLRPSFELTTLGFVVWRANL